MTLHTIYYRAGQAALAIFAAAMIGGAVGVSCAIGIYVGALNITRFERAAKNHVQYVDEANRTEGGQTRVEIRASNEDDRGRRAPTDGYLHADIDSVLPTKTLKPDARIESTPLTFEQTQPPEIVEQLKEYVDRSESYMTEPASRFD